MKRLSALLAAMAMLVSMAAPASAITNGQPDGERHPNVVNLLFVQAGVGYYSCSGTLLSSTWVLTAGHCTGVTVDGVLQPNDVTYVTNETDVNAFFAERRPLYPSLQAFLDAEWVAGEAIPHPGYSDFSAFPDTFDIGLVHLAAPIDTGGVYGQMPTFGQFDYLRTAKGSPSQRMVEVVGYGLLGTIPSPNFYDVDTWARYYGYSTIINTGQSANAGGQNFVYTNSPGKGNGVGGTCSGDSGGPAFWVDPVTGMTTNVIVGVNSYGIAPLCNGNDYQFRTDTAVAQDFVFGTMANHQH